MSLNCWVPSSQHLNRSKESKSRCWWSISIKWKSRGRRRSSNWNRKSQSITASHYPRLNLSPNSHSSSNQWLSSLRRLLTRRRLFTWMTTLRWTSWRTSWTKPSSKFSSWSTPLVYNLKKYLLNRIAVGGEPAVPHPEGREGQGNLGSRSQTEVGSSG